MPNVFVGGLLDSVGEADLCAWFSDYGTVHRAYVGRDHQTGYTRGFGFVDMGNADEAASAIAALNGADLGGRRLTVSLAGNQQRRSPGARPKTQYRDLYVSALPYETTADDLRDLFSRVVIVRDVRMIVNRDGLPSGIAFVTVESHEAAERAIGALDGQSFGGRTLRVSHARPKAGRPA